MNEILDVLVMYACTFKKR